jgi:uncharacterized membrane protein
LKLIYIAGVLTLYAAQTSMKNFFLYLMSAVYIIAGANHFVNPRFYMKIMPPWLPYHAMLVAVSGVCEIAGALLLLPVATREVGAWFIIALLIAVFPANVQMMMNYAQRHNPYLWVTIVRLPLQAVLVWWAWRYV